jgi:hypothetical protein
MHSHHPALPHHQQGLLRLAVCPHTCAHAPQGLPQREFSRSFSKDSHYSCRSCPQEWQLPHPIIQPGTARQAAWSTLQPVPGCPLVLLKLGQAQCYVGPCPEPLSRKQQHSIPCKMVGQQLEVARVCGHWPRSWPYRAVS